MLTIRPFVEGDTQEIIRLILHFQNDGTRPPVTVADQPDLLSISQTYIRSGGNFWVARDGAQLAGTIGLMRHGADQAVLKKFFVYEPYQGAPHHTGRRLYATLLTFARERGVRTLVLDTPRNTHRAHRFYQKAGFHQIAEEELPFRYTRPYADSDFFLLEL